MHSKETTLVTSDKAHPSGAPVPRRKSNPVVGIPASVRLLEFSIQFHGTGYQYLRAVREESAVLAHDRGLA
jgi:hypothetical protein